jgi:hypothetical protein
MPEQFRNSAIAADRISHRMLRILEAAGAQAGEEAVDALYTKWGRPFFVGGPARDNALLSECLAAYGLRSRSRRRGRRREVGRAGRRNDGGRPTRSAGPKSQTPTIVVGANPPLGFKGPVMAPAPTSEAAVRLWDAIQVIFREPGFFEITRPRTNPPRPPVPG